MKRFSYPEETELKELILWVTTDCNLRCRYCYASGGDKAEYMSWPVAKQALDIMLSRSHSFKVRFAGGEPLLNMDLIEQVMEYTRGLGIGYELQTNATLIDDGAICDIKRMGIGIGVSLDGLPDVNDALRPFADGSSSTGATIAGLQKLRSAEIGVGLTCVLSAENVTELPELTKLASYLGNVKGISLDVLRPIGRARGKEKQAEPATAARSVNEALNQVDEIARMGGSRVEFREVKRMRYLLAHNLQRKHRCYLDAGQLLVVKPNGDAYPCSSLTDFPEFYLGNIMDEGFRGKLDSNLKTAHKLIARPERCLNCSYYWLCGGPCPAQTYAQQVNGESKMTECFIRKTLIGYVRRKEELSYASANQTGLPV